MVAAAVVVLAEMVAAEAAVEAVEVSGDVVDELEAAGGKAAA